MATTIRRRSAALATHEPSGYITIRTCYLDIQGHRVCYCPIMLHEDRGMMETVRAMA
jgi:FtsP/CotA-like multicopper oxidase with cupredoxin domain